MKVDLNYLPCTAYAGLRCAFERTNLADQQHFHEWLTQTVKVELGSALALFELISFVDTDRLSDDERNLVRVARAVAEFLLSLVRETHNDWGIGEEKAYLKWERVALKAAGQNPDLVQGDDDSTGAAEEEACA